MVNDKNVPKPFKVFLEGYITTQNHLKQQIHKNTIPCVFRYITKTRYCGIYIKGKDYPKEITLNTMS